MMTNIPIGSTVRPTHGEGSFGGKKRSSLGWQIGPLPQESIGDDELMVSVARMRSGTVDHSSKEPAAIQRRDSRQLVVAGNPPCSQGLGPWSRTHFQCPTEACELCDI